jgi:hypothetical protein
VGDTLRETRCVKPPEGGARLFFRPDPTGARVLGYLDPKPPARWPMAYRVILDFSDAVEEAPEVFQAHDSEPLGQAPKCE